MAAQYVLRLYITGQTLNSVRALENLKDILKNRLDGLYELKVVDVLKHPQLAEQDKVLATPLLVRLLPKPVRKVIGDFSDREKVLLGLDLMID
jgi:circadian clock protein KaiB